jgi:organic hydroperoxide reductase OsmC/OhrA
MSVNIKPKSYEFFAQADWVEGKVGVIKSPGLPDLTASSPPEFRGPAGNWSPETLFVAIINLCTLLTFITFAARGNVELKSYTSGIKGRLEMVDGKFKFTHASLHATIKVGSPDQVEAAKDAFAKAGEHCLIARSCNFPIEETAEITA